jgi:hypothetical protein
MRAPGGPMAIACLIMGGISCICPAFIDTGTCKKSEKCTFKMKNEK